MVLNMCEGQKQNLMRFLTYILRQTGAIISQKGKIFIEVLCAVSTSALSLFLNKCSAASWFLLR